MYIYYIDVDIIYISICYFFFLFFCLRLSSRIYSLLLISVESRNFDIAVMRMVGTSRLGVCRLIIVQALFIAVPPWILGLLCSVPLIKLALGAVVEGRSESLYVSPSAFVWSSLVGILVPVLSSLLPIQAALSTALSQALDYTRPKSVAITYSLYLTGLTIPSTLAVCALVAAALFPFLTPLQVTLFIL